MLKHDLVLRKTYGGTNYDEPNERAKGKVLTIDDTSGSIFNVSERDSERKPYGIFDKIMVDELSEISNDNLITAVILGGLSEEEYEAIRRERA